MKVTILNGSPEPSGFDAYLAQLRGVLESNHHAVQQLDLRDLKLRYCTGCFGCWVKTPGECVTRDASLEIDQAIINADFVLWAAPLKMGYPARLLKMALDKHIPLIHPYIEVAYGEAHHRPRYPRYPRTGLLIEKEATTDERDLKIVNDLFCRTAINFKTRLEFSLTIDCPAVEVAERIGSPVKKLLPLPDPLPATRGGVITPPTRLTLFNGSPRGRKGSTPVLLEQIALGFNRPVETYHLVHLKDTPHMVQAFAHSECVILGLPLYTDAMPGIVKHFIEALEPLAGRGDNPPLGFLVQSGFPEALHSRYLERYLEKLASRLGSPYLGTIVKGSGEGIHSMPDRVTKVLFQSMRGLGASLASQGQFDPQVLARLATPERFPAILGPLFRLFLHLPVAHQYFDDMLKKNGAFERRFARPFTE